MTYLQSLAQRVGARDLFVLHRLDPGSLVNLDGAGRGAGWAGNIRLEPHAEPWLAEVLARGRARFHSGVPTRLFGPYWTTAAAGIVTGGHVVVFGGPGVDDIDDEALARIADLASATVGEVPVEKLLADELEVTQVALAIARLRPAGPADAARAIADLTARALGCEFGATVLSVPSISLHLVDEGWRPLGSPEEILSALLPLGMAAAGDLVVEQETGASALAYPPVSADDGLVSRAAVGLGAEGDLGFVVVGHSADAPRGFTGLCQRVAREAARAATAVLEGSGVAAVPR